MIYVILDLALRTLQSDTFSNFSKIQNAIPQLKQSAKHKIQQQSALYEFSKLICVKNSKNFEFNISESGFSLKQCQISKFCLKIRILHAIIFQNHLAKLKTTFQNALCDFPMLIMENNHGFKSIFLFNFGFGSSDSSQTHFVYFLRFRMQFHS